MIENHIEHCVECKQEIDLRRKQIRMTIIAIIITMAVLLAGMKYNMDVRRSELYVNEMITSTAIEVDRTPREVIQNKGNGVEILTIK